MDYYQDDPGTQHLPDPRFPPPHAPCRLADTTGDRIASRAGASEGGALSEATLGKGRPDLALVVTASKGRIRVQDGVASLDEVGVAGLAVRWLAPRFPTSLVGEKGVAYSAIPSETSFMVRNFPSVGTPLESKVGFCAVLRPCLSIRFHMTS